jgi:SCP-2 sterol transfer family
MATIEECRSALDQLSANLARAEDGVRDATALDRSLSCRVKDLGVTFVGRLADGRIQDITAVRGVPAEKAQIRLTMTGDDLVALVGGRLNFTRAWGSGRVKVQASVRDVLRLRALL